MQRRKNANKYWETEKGELVEIGDGKFLRCYDQAGKLQFGNNYFDSKTGKEVYAVKIVIDRKELLESKEGMDYLRQTLDDWENEDYDN